MPADKATGRNEAGGVQAVLFALQIMEHVAAQAEPIGVTTLAEYFGTSKSRIHRHLKTLEQQGYVVQDPLSERYRIGARLVALGHVIAESVDIIREAAPVMRKVRDALRHSVVLSMIDRGGVRVVRVEPGTSVIEITVKPGSLMEYHSSAQGKIALAHGGPRLLEATLERPLAALTEHTITQTQALQAELEQVRAQGWAAAPNEAVIGLNALAVPVFDAAGRLAASIAIVDSLQFIGAPPSQTQIDTMRAAGRALSESIGFRPRTPMR
jgi:IclR family transcriptional regulator, KDG regulon repressor